jgi:NADH-quinone oxidoreductase subunit E
MVSSAFEFCRARGVTGKVNMDVSGRVSDDEAVLENISQMLAATEKRRENLIPILQQIQQEHSYLSPEAMELVARRLDISSSEVYGVATFYNQFRFHPPGKHQIKVCLGTACHVVGGDIILENFERKLGIKEGETTPDREFSIEKVACVGCCALAPVAIVDEVVQARMAPSKVEGILLGFDIEREREEREKQQVESEK